jgi:hypothetical protein
MMVMVVTVMVERARAPAGLFVCVREGGERERGLSPLRGEEEEEEELSLSQKLSLSSPRSLSKPPRPRQQQ